ncbi:hypothetical protein EGW08_006484, partial [Elysia chlorotica]
RAGYHDGQDARQARAGYHDGQDARQARAGYHDGQDARQVRPALKARAGYHDGQDARQARQAALDVPPTGDPIPESTSSHSVCLRGDDSAYGKNWGKNWLSSPSTGDVCPDPGETAQSEDGHGHLTQIEMQPLLTDFRAVKEKSPRSVCKSSDNIDALLVASPQQIKVDLGDFKVQLKHHYPVGHSQVQTSEETPPGSNVHQIQAGGHINMVDQLCGCNPTHLDNTTTMGSPDLQQNPSVGNNEQTHCLLPSSFGLNLKHGSTGHHSVPCTITPNVARMELETGNKPLRGGGSHKILDQLIGCWEIGTTKDVSGITVDDINRFEPAEEDMSDILDLHQEKQNLLLKQEMHLLYVKAGSVNSVTSTQPSPVEKFRSGSESYHDKFLQFAGGDLGSLPPSPDASVQVDVDFYTQSFLL